MSNSHVYHCYLPQSIANNLFKIIFKFKLGKWKDMGKVNKNYERDEIVLTTFNSFRTVNVKRHGSHLKGE